MSTLQTTDENFCVFQIGPDLFGIAAPQLREVGLRPQLANVPTADDMFAGLWHEGSEFLPVLRIVSRTNESREEQQMLVISGSQGAWGLLADQVMGIEKLECKKAESSTCTPLWRRAHVADATRNDEAVHILNANELYASLEEVISSAWSTTES